MEIPVRILDVLDDMLVSPGGTRASVSTPWGTQPLPVYVKCVLCQLRFLLTIQVVLSIL